MPIPSPKERPDLYDSDLMAERPEGWVNPIEAELPEHMRTSLEAVKKRKLKRAAE